MDSATGTLRTSGRAAPDGPPPCEDVRQDLCRFAAGVATSQPVAELARHAQRCRSCSNYVDDVARVRAWLERRAADPTECLATVAALAQRAREALARELTARLARDLRDLGDGKSPRPVPLRRLDLRRLVALCGPEPLRDAPWPAAVRLLVRSSLSDNPTRRGSERDRALAFKLAARLDPLGLDVALCHIAVLEHTGRRSAADAEADRLLGLLV